jgi:hypothetical protein
VIALARLHPARLAAGAASIFTRKAREANQPILSVIGSDGERYARQTVDLVSEIATDAEYLQSRILAAASDNVITPAELAEIQAIAAEIGEEATTGRIISTGSR